MFDNVISWQSSSYNACRLSEVVPTFRDSEQDWQIVDVDLHCGMLQRAVFCQLRVYNFFLVISLLLVNFQFFRF